MNDRTVPEVRTISRLASIVESSGDAILSAALDGTIDSWNCGAEALLGYPAVEIVGQPLSHLIPRGNATDAPTLLARAARGQSYGPYDAGWLRRDGHLVEVSVNVSPLRDNSGAVDGVAIIARDASARKRLERAAGEREHWYSAIWDLAADAMALSDAEARVILANQALLRLCGRPARDVIGISLSAVLPPDHRAAFDQQYRKLLLDSDAILSLEVPLLGPDGAPRIVEAHARVVASASGYRWVVTAFRDVTERRRAEEGQRFLAEASKVLASSLDFETTLKSIARLAVQAMADYCLVDLLEADGTVRRVAAAHRDPNMEPVTSALLRYPPSLAGGGIIARTLRTGEPILLPTVSVEHYQRAARDGTHLELIRRLEPRSYMSVPLRSRGRTLGCLFFGSARPDRIYDQADLSIAEDLARRCALAIDNAALYRASQEAIQARDEFFAAAAHELKTPITSLRGFAQLVVRQIDRTGALDPDRVRRALRTIDAQSGNLAVLVNHLLDVAQLESGPITLDRRETDLVALANAAIEAAERTVDKHPPRTIVRRMSAPVHARVDALRIEQVLINLLDNAVKYSPQGGSIEVDVSAPAPDVAVVSVRDHGIGIPPDHLEKVFERFNRVGGSRHLDGFGLALYVSRQIVAMHGGTLVAEAPPDGGTRFVVTLPTGVEPGV